ncbi:response regulator [Sphingomonas sinipercae]|uniref:histidine kinase n=2 Tax=Sphingomonas sinipercae TaxID=2714944 RepID=A0A6G7ZR01_9SPHN|nr:response regulator [Sphingomonas sinipercae]
MLRESNIPALICSDIDCLVRELRDDIGFVLVTEEALLGRDLRPVANWIDKQPEWSDLPFVLLTHKGGGLERNPEAGRFLDMLGNVTFLERPFHPTTLISLARAALRARSRQYEARARLVALQESQESLKTANETLEARVAERTREHEQALARLHEAQKLETLGQLTGGVAHDFNNLLTPVIGNLDLLRRRLEPGDRSHRLIDASLQAASRASTLVQRLLAFARRQDLRPRSIDIASLLDGMTDLIRRSLDPAIEVEISHADELPPARVDPNQLELAVLNLAINARDAMPRGGKLEIIAAAETVKTAGRLQPGDYVRISVRDEGSGMDADTLSRAVEPFFSTKGVGKGTGLGLSMVHGLAAQLGGMLSLKSEKGVGTQADIWLPVASEAPVATDVDVRSVIPASRRATILLVDDEELVRTGTADMLSDLGYDVVDANSGAEALKMLRDGVEPDLLISDYLMPGMNGVELITQARTLAPAMQAMLITGYSTIAEGPGASLPRLAKPFRHAELAEFVAELLAENEGGTVLPFRSDRSASGPRDN